MKIFLNDRIIVFTREFPEPVLPSDKVVEFRGVEEFNVEWSDFCRYEKFKAMYIVNADGDDEEGVAFLAFRSLFKYVIAAGGIVRNEKGDYLFIHRFGHWDLPKGKINKKDYHKQVVANDEDRAAQRAAVREVKEETGLQKVTLQNELSPTWHIYFEKERWIIKKTRWFSMESDSGQPLVPQTSEGIFLVKWTSPSAIHCILAHTYASIRELLLEIVF